MNERRVIIDKINNSLFFGPGYYIYIKATLSIKLSLPRLPIEKAAIRIGKNIIPQNMIKRDSKKNKTDCLQLLIKLSS